MRSLKGPVLHYPLVVLIVSSGWIQFIDPENMVLSIIMMVSFVLMSIIDGSLSNHVVTSVTLALIILSCSSRNRLRAQSLSGLSTRWCTAVLYLSTGIHKLNVDFFNPRHSCASLFASGAFAAIPLRVLELSGVHACLSFLVKTAPYAAILIEIGVPLAIIASIFWDTDDRKLGRIIVFAGSLFHAVLALPPSPLSVYPFSAVMVPVYVYLVPDNVDLEGVVDKVISPVWTRALIVLTFVLAYSYAPYVLFGETELFEYPNYDMWGCSLVWNCLWWALIAYSCATAVKPSAQPVPAASRIRFSSWTILILFGMFAMTPYIGLRNYPALAMFSNLRTEGTRPNQLTADWDLFNYQKDWVEIIDSNFAPIVNFQVDIAPMFPQALKRTIQSFNAENEFFICPPKWDMPNPTVAKFVDFNIPFIELRRRVSQYAWNQTEEPVFVEYIRHYPDGKVKPSRFESSQIDEFDDVIQPLNVFERTMVRFRSFSNMYSPCRH